MILCPGLRCNSPLLCWGKFGRGRSLPRRVSRGYISGKWIFYVRNHAFSCIFEWYYSLKRYSYFNAQKHETIIQNVGRGTFAILPPTKLQGDMSPVASPLRFRRLLPLHSATVDIGKRTWKKPQSTSNDLKKEEQRKTKEERIKHASGYQSW